MTNTEKPTNLWFEYSLLYLCGLYRPPDIVDLRPLAFDVSEFGEVFSYNIWKVQFSKNILFLKSLKYVEDFP